MRIENWYDQELKFGDFELQIDASGFVTCSLDGELGHLEACLEIGDLITNLFDAAEGINICETALQNLII